MAATRNKWLPNLIYRGEQMKIRANMHFKDAYTCDEEYIIERAVTISSAEFDYICKHLLEDNGYVKDNLDVMYCDEKNKFHCLLLINESTGDGLLINSEGSEYARYHSYIPNARQIVILNKYPVLNNFIERMSDVADDILAKATASSTEENRFYEVDIERYNKSGEPVINAALLDDMLMDSGMVEDSILHDVCIEITLNKISREPVKRVLDQKDVDIMLAKHILWLNDAGGEQADFSNCRLEHLHLSGKNMLNVILDDAEIIGCDLENAEMCFSACNNTRFETCIMKKITAEECDFKNATFDNCNLERAGFMHSDFTNAKFLSTKMCYAELSNSCLENMQSKNTDLSQTNMNNVSYDEDEWLYDDENLEMEMGGM